MDGKAILDRLDDDFAEAPVIGFVGGVVAEGVLGAEFIADLAEGLGQIGVESVEVGGSGLCGKVAENRHALMIGGGHFIVVDLRVADGVDERVGSLGGGDGIDLIVGARVFFAVGEEDEDAAAAVGISELLLHAGVDRVEECGSSASGGVGVELGEVSFALVETVERVDHHGGRIG